MELYSSISYKTSRLLTRAYSTSFGISSLFFSKEIRSHIYAIYGLVRIADEIVDTYKGKDAGLLLKKLEEDTYQAIVRGYDPNPIIQAFSETARRYSIDHTLIKPFFESMRIDLTVKQFDEISYRSYIYGSAEVIGLMCLRIFCQGNVVMYTQLESGAIALGAAYQKVNFLRDMTDDYKKLGRVYFPNVTLDTFSKTDKQVVIQDIKKDFTAAHKAVIQLPRSSRIATMVSYTYYEKLFYKLAAMSASDIKQKRVRISNFHKLLLLIKVVITDGLKK